MSETVDMIKFSDMKSVKQKTDYIKQKMSTSDKWLLRGLLAIYDYQTEQEKCVDSTLNNNGVGFSAFDAEFLSSVAKRGFISPRQLPYVRKSMIKYAGQLVRVAEKKNDN